MPSSQCSNRPPPHRSARAPAATLAVVVPVVLALALAAVAELARAQPRCEAVSGVGIAPVIELYTSEGCSSCPPADQWLSGLRRESGGQPGNEAAGGSTRASAPTGAVIQAFHVGYWDYLGWVDRFATPAHAQRQREIARREGLRTIYTPQVLRQGQDWPGWADSRDPLTLVRRASPGPAAAQIELRRIDDQRYEARVRTDDRELRWAAYWTVTEHGHVSRVRAGENAGETLRHDFVVRQYTPVGEYRGSQRLELATLAPTAGHARQINLVLTEPGSGRTVQALSLACAMPG